MQNQTAADSTPATTITKRIGNINYKIQIHFSKTSKDSFSDKLIRIIKTQKPKGEF